MWCLLLIVLTVLGCLIAFWFNLQCRKKALRLHIENRLEQLEERRQENERWLEKRKQEIKKGGLSWSTKMCQKPTLNR